MSEEIVITLCAQPDCALASGVYALLMDKVFKEKSVQLKVILDPSAISNTIDPVILVSSAEFFAEIKNNNKGLIYHCDPTNIDYVALQHFMNVAHYKHEPKMRSASLVVIRTPKGIIGFQRKDGGLALPCGSIDDGELPENAAVREVKEETGISISVDELDPYGCMISPSGVLVYTYMVTLADNVTPSISKGFENEGYPTVSSFKHGDTFGTNTDRFFDFNNLLLRNMKIT